MDALYRKDFPQYFSSKEFHDAYFYGGNDLGAVWTREKTSFRLWAPTAEQVTLNLYQSGNGDSNIERISMEKDIFGTWLVTKDGDLDGIYYTYSVTVDNMENETVDPYAKAVGVNGIRGMVIDLNTTSPKGFADEYRPPFMSPTDAVIYEIHVRDFSMDESSGLNWKGKYLAFTEEDSVNSYGESTGVSHLKELGVTHIHLLPSFDFATIDESKDIEEQYNWGYDPDNYNTPEGSYSTDPYHARVRIKEFKQLIHSMHANGIRVIMDVVYNHTYHSYDSNFNKTVPGYYYRMTPEGYFSNASGCGNETASERPMVRKYIVDSVIYWAAEYHIDGFRFDLMGIHDIQTMNEIRNALDRIDPGILIYGEGWTGGLSLLPEWERAIKPNMVRLDKRIAIFSDDFRDGIKGSVFSAYENGFISGRDGMEETIKFGVVGSTYHPQIDYNKVIYYRSPWAKEPTQVINYMSAHDNLTLWDKITLSNLSEAPYDRIKMNLLAAAILFTSQGIPFLQSGEDFLRSKPKNKEGTEFDDNSYRSPDFTNSIKWDMKSTNIGIFCYYKGLIEFRKLHKAFRYSNTSQIQENLRFIEGLEPKLISFLLKETVDEYQNNIVNTICVIYNANRHYVNVPIPKGEWRIYVKGDKAGTQVLDIVNTDMITVEPISAMVIIKEG